MFTRSMRWAYIVTAWIILVAVFVQVFLAGLGLFVAGEYFGLHAMFGTLLGLLMLIELGFAFAARLPRGAVGLTALLPALVILQILFVEIGRAGPHVVSALHPVNALVIFGVAALIAWRARGFVPTRASASVPTTTMAPEKLLVR